MKPSCVSCDMKNEELRIRLVAVVFLAIVLVAVAVAAGNRGKSVTISGSESGDDLQITVSKALALGVLEGIIGSNLTCDGKVDSEFGHLLATLDRGGRGARASLQDGDSVIHARRRANTLKFDIKDRDGGGELEVVMPWAIAECMLGRDVVLDKSARKIKVEVRGADGGKFEFKVD